ncbi:proline-tRNA ligase [Trichosporon asahii var. asahii CBS 2479]|uniref:proline--tRNA ligase n=1 Tax=Trichosporon asahii var. asahii (strain ATCC 90039 / CBS 2479 / JCM 2466 / KCTC 7840 / NBRC 103889/ NCYC 2677 / UAMH 7654) TaxID=1186058 RepID=J4UIJ8_TRIAS|nr:proline-tRNA ligase [Trichosporon asahii var. asahii CBS 2479]EJT51495.1 proline-tRNA ligase [Trichosporon asahii var. asahii CBS 2479]
MLSRPFAAFIKAARTPTLQAPTASLLARRTYSTPKKLRVPYPAMAAVSDQEIISRLGKLNIAAPEVHKHAAVQGGAEWRAELDKIGQKGVQLTKTLLFKPKTAKSAEPTPVLVVAKDDTETSSGPLGALLKLKDLRLAAADLIKQVIPSAESKDDVSALPLPSPVPSTLFIVLDKAVASSSDLFALHLTTSASTVFLKGTDVKAYLESIAPSPEAVRVVDFAELKANAPAPQAKAAPKAAAKEQPKKAAKDDDLYEMAIQHKKEEDFPGWYTDVVVKGQLIDYYDISGCYILRPASYTIWQTIQEFFDGRIKKLGVQDCYFPMFVSQARLEREKDHIEGFAPEVAWVTKAGKSDLEEHIAIRPTSETVMYPYYAKWIKSHRDLPLKLNQWNSVVRWEFKNPQPFLRTREFLWQEGHTAFLTKAEADKEVTDILDLYRQVYEDYLAVPVIPGVKSENEKFAGADYTTTVEGFIPTTGRGIQGGTSHHLGQNFSKMFEINVEDPKATQADREAGKDTKVNVYQNSWGLSTRTIGVMVMTHGDDQGLVFPPKVALTQVVVVPVGLSKGEGKNQPIYDACQKLADELSAAGIRATADLREGYTPGWKFNDWEMRGVPLRLELGPRDIAAGTTLAVRRYDNFKESYPLEGIAKTVEGKLEDIQKALFDRALDKFNASVRPVTQWKDIVPTLDAKCAVVIPLEAMKGQDEDSKAPSAGAKSLCIPFDQDRFGKFPEGENQKCAQCDKKAKRWALFGRSY